MLNRRFLRIKVLQEIYAYRQSEVDNLAVGERNLLASIDSLYELFIRQLSLMIEVKLFAERRIDENKHKNFPTEEDLNPNLKFVNNRVLNMLDNNKNIMRLEKEYKFNWGPDREDFIRGCYNRIREYQEYLDYMNNGIDSFEDDRNFILSVLDNHMADDDDIFDYFADRNLYYNGDYQLVMFLVWKFINEMPADFGPDTKLPPLYKTQYDEVNIDRNFVIILFRETLLHAEEYKELVSANISNWDYSRIALMDKILVFMALTEFIQFHDIPVKDTINEYIENSKSYSTPDSRRFINGLLDKLSEILKEEGKMVKTGRGLIDS